MRKFALALALGVLLCAGPMCRAFAGDDDDQTKEKVVKMIEKLLSGSKGDRAKLIAEIEKLAREFSRERAGRDDDDDDDRNAEDYDEAAEHANHGGFLGIQADKGEHCVKVVRVLPGTAAAKAGLRADDEVTEVNGQKIDEVKDLVARISSFKPGSEVTLSVLRGGKTKSLKATLGTRPAAEADEDDDDDDGGVKHDEKSEHEGRGVRGHDEKREHENGGKGDDDDDD